MSAAVRITSEGKPYQRSDGKWCAPFYVDGRKHYAYGTSDRAARARRRTKIDTLRTGMPTRPARTTVAEYVDHWIANGLRTSSRARTTQAQMATLLRVHVVPALGATELGKVTPSRVEGLLADLQTREASPLSASTCRSIYAALRGMYDTAVRDQVAMSNPVEKVQRPRVPKRAPEFLDREQLKVLGAAVAEDRLAGLWQLLIATGVRRGEALALRWNDIDLDAGVLRIEASLGVVDGVLTRGEVKGNKMRSLRIGSRLIANLRAHRARQGVERLVVGSEWPSTGYVFTTEFGQPLNPSTVGHRLAKIGKRVGLSVTPHVLRHSAATAMLTDPEVPLAMVSEYLGHESQTVTLEVYSHVPEAARQIAANALDKLG